MDSSPPSTPSKLHTPGSLDSRRKKLLARSPGEAYLQAERLMQSNFTESKPVFLEDLSNPPTADELDRFVDLPPSVLPVKYRRGMAMQICFSL